MASSCLVTSTARMARTVATTHQLPNSDRAGLPANCADKTPRVEIFRLVWLETAAVLRAASKVTQDWRRAAKLTTPATPFLNLAGHRHLATQSRTRRLSSLSTRHRPRHNGATERDCHSQRDNRKDSDHENLPIHTLRSSSYTKSMTSSHARGLSITRERVHVGARCARPDIILSAATMRCRSLQAAQHF